MNVSFILEKNYGKYRIPKQVNLIYNYKIEIKNEIQTELQVEYYKHNLLKKNLPATESIVDFTDFFLPK